MANEHEPNPQGDSLARPPAPAPASGQAAPGAERPESPPPQTQWRSPAGGSQRRSPSDLSQILLVWCLWLLGSWVVIRKISGLHLRELPFGIFSPASPPSAKWMVYAAMLGLMLVWPAVRLSQHRHRPTPGLDPRSVALVLMDWLGMMALLQLVLWPLQSMANWSIAEAAWMDTLIASWSLLTGVILAWGLQFPRGAMRALAMGLCVALVFAEPVILALVNVGGPLATWQLTVSPLGLLGQLTVPHYDFVAGPWAWHITAGALAAVVAWISMLIATLRSQRRQ